MKVQKTGWAWVLQGMTEEVAPRESGNFGLVVVCWAPGEGRLLETLVWMRNWAGPLEDQVRRREYQRGLLGV